MHVNIGARNVLNDDTILLNGDDVFEIDVLRKIISNKDEICVPYKINFGDLCPPFLKKIFESSTKYK